MTLEVFINLIFAILGVSLAFLVIIGLSVMVLLFRSNNQPQIIQAPAPGPAPVAAAAAPASVSAGAPYAAPSGDEDEVVAVITAAIAAICGGGARILSVSPAGGAGTAGSSAWRIEGRFQNFEGVE
ncbi:hypothetical protein FACS1894216_18840 [Synergistales bacterium]|nr:hypothetical protein FACS1894216_18840 [Synergistales bacterium]